MCQSGFLSSIRFRPTNAGKSAGGNWRSDSGSDIALRCPLRPWRSVPTSEKFFASATKQALLELSVETFLETPLMKQKKSKKRTRILVLEPDEHLASAIMSSLQEAAPDALVEMTRSLEAAQQLALGVKPELFVLDVDAAPDLGQDFLYDLRTSHPNARAIILTGVHLPEQREQVAGLGAIHFLEKPVAHWDFVELVQRLLRPATETATKEFQGTPRDLQFADIIQLKCMSSATAVLEFTGPNDEKAHVFFEKGQV